MRVEKKTILQKTGEMIKKKKQKLIQIQFNNNNNYDICARFFLKTHIFCNRLVFRNMYTAQGHCICMWKEHERSPGRERHVSIAHFALYSVYANGLVCCIACYKYGNLIPEKYRKKWADHVLFYAHQYMQRHILRFTPPD